MVRRNIHDLLLTVLQLSSPQCTILLILHFKCIAFTLFFLKKIMSNKGVYLSRANRYNIFLIIHFMVYPQPCLCLSCITLEYTLTLFKQIKQLNQVYFNKTLYRKILTTLIKTHMNICM
jgi:hypothetical protein